MSEDFVGALYRETEGNPFFIEEVVKALIEQGQIYREGDRWERNEMHELAIPQSVKEAIGRRLTRLREPTVDALRIAAALGKIFPFRELAAVSSATEDALLDALDEASAAQLIRASTGGAGDMPLGGDDTLRLHPRQDPRGALRGAEPHPPSPSPPSNRRNAGKAVRAKRLGRRGRAVANRPARAGPRPSLHARRRASQVARVFAPRGARRRKRLRARRGAPLPRAGARGRRGAAAPGRAPSDRRRDGGHPRSARHDAAGGGELRARPRHGDGNPGACRDQRQDRNDVLQRRRPAGAPYLEAAVATLDPATQTNELAVATASIGRYYHYRTEHSKAIEFFQRARQLAEPLDDAGTLALIYSFLAGGHQHLLMYNESDRWARTSIAMGERKKYPVAVALGYEFLSENESARGKWDGAVAFAAANRDEGGKAGALARVAWSGFPTAQSLHGKGSSRQPARLPKRRSNYPSESARNGSRRGSARWPPSSRRTWATTTRRASMQSAHGRVRRSSASWC